MTIYQAINGPVGGEGTKRDLTRMNSSNNFLATVAAIAAIAFSATASADMGRTEGSWSVAPSGSMTYSIPLWVQPGPKGMQPSLAFVYDSQGGNGTMGVGWSLAGFSSIDRCRWTLLEDGETKPLNFDETDRFCLGGNKLRITSGPLANYGSAGAVYQTANEVFSRITSVGGSAENGPEHFIVHAKSGLIYEYGNSSDSRIELGGGKVYRWLLNKVSDRDGNSYAVTYTTDNATGRSPLAVFWSPTTAGGSNYRYQASFNYSNKWSPLDWVGGRIGTVDLVNKQRLDSVVIGYSASGTSHTPVRQYRLGYVIQTPAGEKDVSPSTGRSRLTSIKECGATEANCLKPTILTYQDREPGMTSSATNVPAVSGANMTRYDFNGDGRTDLAFFSGTWKVVFSSGNGFSSPVDTGVSAVSARIGKFAATNVDGFLFNIGNVWQYAAANSGGVFTTTSTGAPVASGNSFQSTTSDANGDGLIDLVYTTTGQVGSQRYAYVNVRRNTTSGAAVIPAFSPSTYVALAREVGPNGGAINILPYGDCPSNGLCDLNGDGTPDLKVLLTTTFGCGPSGCSPVTSAYDLLSGRGFYSLAPVSSTSATDPFIGMRFNSDQCVDTIQHNTLTLRVNPCGTGTAATVTLPAPYLTFLDWNNDGKTDLISNNGGTIGVYLSNGVLSTPFTPVVSTSIPYSSACTYSPADVDADGLDELVCSTSASTTFYRPNGGGSIGSPGGTAVFSTQVADLLSNLTDGFGLSVSPAYVSIPQSNYTRGTNTVLPLMDAGDVKHVVGRITVTDGNAAGYNLDYTYMGMRRNMARDTPGENWADNPSGLSWNGAFAGFEQITVVDSRNGIKQKTTFEQLYPLVGMVKLSELLQANDTPISSMENVNLSELLDPTTNNTRYFPYVSQSVAKSHELDGDLVATTTTTYHYATFAYGNVETTTTVVTDNDGDAIPSLDGSTWTTTVTNTYAPPLTSGSDWCIDFVDQTQVEQSSTAPGVGDPVTRTVSFTANGSNPSLCRIKTKKIAPNTAYEVMETYDYDDFGNVDNVQVIGKMPATGGGYVDMPARTTQIDWGATGQFPVSVTDPSGAVYAFAHNPESGTVKDVFDPNSSGSNVIKTSLLYDDFARVTRLTRPDGTYTTTTYQDCATAGGCVYPTHKLTVKEADYDGQQVLITDRYAYRDTFDRVFVTRTRQLDGATWGGSYQWLEMQYDLRGRVYKQYLPCTTASATASCRLHAVSHSYDILSRLTQASRPRSQGDANLQSDVYTYDGRRQTITDALQRTSQRIVNVDGTVRQIKDANGYSINFEYDAAGSLTRISDSQNVERLHSVSIAYGVKPFQVAATDSALGSQTRAFNSLGDLVAWTDAKGQSFSATYDGLSRPLERWEPDSYTAWEWGNDKLKLNIGKLRHVESTANEATYKEDYFYDSRGRLSQRAITIPDQGTFDYEYVYHPVKGWVDTLKYPETSLGARLALQYGYQNGVVQSVADANSNTKIWEANSSNAWGQLNHEKFGNNIERHKTIDDVTARLASIQTGPSINPTQYQSLSFLYDYIGNVTQRQNNKLGLTETFYYGGATDNLDRLAYSTLNNGTNVVENLRLEYDPSGNILEKSELGLPEVLVDQMVEWTSYNYPSKITTGTEVATFAYGPDRQRWKMGLVGSLGTENTYYIGGLVEKVVVGASIEFRHTISSPGGAVAIYTLSTSADPVLRYVFGDHQGSTETFVESATGGVENSSFSAYGTRRNAATWSGDSMNGSDLDAITRQGYTFQTMLGSMGLIHMNGRVQDPILGRFLSADPYITEPMQTQNYNRYSYVYNNPLSALDPSGFGLVWHAHQCEGAQPGSSAPANPLSNDSPPLQEQVVTGLRARGGCGTWVWEPDRFDHINHFRVVEEPAGACPSRFVCLPSPQEKPTQWKHCMSKVPTTNPQARNQTVTIIGDEFGTARYSYDLPKDTATRGRSGDLTVPVLAGLTVGGARGTIAGGAWGLSVGVEEAAAMARVGISPIWGAMTVGHSGFSGALLGGVGGAAVGTLSGLLLGANADASLVEYCGN